MSRVRSAMAMAVIAVAALPMGTAHAVPQTKPTLAEKLVERVTLDGVNRHLLAWQRIADRNGGHRADPSPGFTKTQEYIESTLRTAGFEVSSHEFTYDRVVIDKSVVVAGPVSLAPNPLIGSPDTAVGGVTGPLAVVPADADSGCQATDYAGLNTVGAVALVKRGGCAYTQKMLVAEGLGAIAVVFYNHSVGAVGGVVDAAQARIPSAMLGSADGAKLTGSSGVSTNVEVRRHVEATTSRNVIGQTRTGRKDNVILLGTHSDSVTTSPGVNDNGSNAAATLELARKLGGSPRVNNAVRFAFWGADVPHSGAAPYLNSLSDEQRLDLAMYLDVAPLGSPNGGHFVFDGDNSAGQAGAMPHGSAQIEKTLVDFMTSIGVQTEPAPVVGQGNYATFIAAGIPTGGPFAGIPHIKTPAQAAKWGGTAGLAFDPCNLAPCDNLGNINRDILSRNADALAFVTGTYAMSTEDVNGIPPRDRRAATRVAKSLTPATVAGENA
ncbi:MAG TPA: M28 family peptidase [Actinokineospora sp.]|nr:M28 family peptidase [Actinokineospora sp.]